MSSSSVGQTVASGLKFSPLVERIAGKGADVWRVHFKAKELIESGRTDVTLLTVGDPDLPPPRTVVDKAVHAMQHGRTTYSNIAGDPALRAAIAKRVTEQTHNPCSPSNVVITPGAQAGLFTTFQCLVSAGDEIIVPEPMYATYEAVAGASGASLVTVSLNPNKGFHLRLETLEQAITPRTRVVWINSPHNPTGAVMTREEMEAVCALCKKHNLWLVSDEVYSELTHSAPHISAWSMPDMQDRTVVLNSLSKSHALPGFRCGWVVCPPQLVAHLCKLLLCMTYGGPPFIQDAAVVAVSEDMPEIAQMREAYRRRAELIATKLFPLDPIIKVLKPEGGMFVLLDVRDSGLTSEQFAMQLLDQDGIALTPCDGFGPSAKGHLRMSLGASDEVLERATAKIMAFVHRYACC